MAWLAGIAQSQSPRCCTAFLHCELGVSSPHSSESTDAIRLPNLQANFIQDHHRHCCILFMDCLHYLVISMAQPQVPRGVDPVQVAAALDEAQQAQNQPVNDVAATQAGQVPNQTTM